MTINAPSLFYIYHHTGRGSYIAKYGLVLHHIYIVWRLVAPNNTYIMQKGLYLLWCQCNYLDVKKTVILLSWRGLLMTFKVTHSLVSPAALDKFSYNKLMKKMKYDKEPQASVIYNVYFNLKKGGQWSIQLFQAVRTS